MTRPAVLVTGAAKRIGAAIAGRFGEAGWHVIVHYHRSKAEADKLAASLPSAEALQCDLVDLAQVEAMAIDLADRLTDWRCLINCAAIFPRDEVTALDTEANRKAMLVNATSPLRLAQAFFAQARSENGRRMIQITDQKLANMNPDFTSYTMSKAAADAAAQMLAMSVDGDDRVYRLAPGAILPSHDQSHDEAERSHRMNLLERRTEADEVADAALFLATGPLVTGQELYVDSGQHLLHQDRDVIFLDRQGAQRR